MYKFNEDIQRGILYLVKTNIDFFSQIVPLVKEEYFEFPSHQNIYRSVVSYKEKYGLLPKDEVIIEECRQTKGPKEDISEYIDEVAAINSLNGDVIEHKEYYLDLVEKFARKQAMRDAIAQSIQLIKDGDVDQVEGLVRKALMVSRIVDNGVDYFKAIDERWERTYNPSKNDKFKLFLRTMNAVLEGGMSRKELLMVAAMAGVGKSVALCNQAVESLMEGRKVLYVSLEMSEDKIAQRIDSITTLINQNVLKNNLDQVKERHQIFREAFPGGNLKIKEFATGATNVNHIRALISQLQNYEDFTPDVILVDYLELLRPLNDGMAEYLAQERIAQELRGLGFEYNAWVVTATQVNRAGASVELITDAHLADSYGKIRTADVGISLNQTQQEYDTGVMRGYVMKSRNSRSKFVMPMLIDYNTLRMTEGTIEVEAELDE